MLESEVCTFDAVIYSNHIRFYKEEKDSIDVLFLGSSHTYCGFSPMQIWEESGITSYNLGTASQTIPCSYYLLKEGIRTQHPKLVVLELYGAHYEDDYVSKARLHESMDGIPFSRTKVEMFREFLPYTMDFHERLEYIFPIIRYHTRWDRLEDSDYHPQNLFLRGYQPRYEVKAQKKPKSVTKKDRVNERVMEYLEWIIELCEENDIQLLACETPMGKQKQYKKVCRSMNAMSEYLADRGIPCVDFKRLDEDIHLDYSTDFLDSTHVNVYGAEKVTAYMTAYVQQHYDLSDHRGDSDYADWEQDAAAYHTLLKEREEKTGSPR